MIGCFCGGVFELLALGLAATGFTGLISYVTGKIRIKHCKCCKHHQNPGKGIGSSMVGNQSVQDTASL